LFLKNLPLLFVRLNHLSPRFRLSLMTRAYLKYLRFRLSLMTLKNLPHL
jgi:hypothetical protein